MGVRAPKTVFDLSRFDLDLGVRCERCRRVAVFAPFQAYAWLEQHGYPTGFPLQRHPFRCRCGSREVKTIGVARRDKPSGAMSPDELRPLYVIEPERSGRR